MNKTNTSESTLNMIKSVCAERDRKERDGESKLGKAPAGNVIGDIECLTTIPTGCALDTG